MFDGGLLLFALPLAAMWGGIWSLVGVLSWPGKWRAIASAPIVAFFAYVAVFLAPNWRRDPTSHNLWPFKVGIWLSPSLPYMAVVAAIRRDRARRAP